MRESEGKGEVGEKRGRKRERREGRRGKIENSKANLTQQEI